MSSPWSLFSWTGQTLGRGGGVPPPCHPREMEWGHLGLRDGSLGTPRLAHRLCGLGLGDCLGFPICAPAAGTPTPSGISDRPSAGGGGPVTTGAASETDEGARRVLGLVPDASEDWLSLCWRCGSCVWRCGSADLGPGDLRRKQRLGPEPRWGAAPPSCAALPAH